MVVSLSEISAVNLIVGSHRLVTKPSLESFNLAPHRTGEKLQATELKAGLLASSFLHGRSMEYLACVQTSPLPQEKSGEETGYGILGVSLFDPPLSINYKEAS